MEKTMKGCFGWLLYWLIGVALSAVCMLVWNFGIVPIASQWTTLPLASLLPTTCIGTFMFTNGILVGAAVIAWENGKKERGG